MSVVVLLAGAWVAHWMPSSRSQQASAPEPSTLPPPFSLSGVWRQLGDLPTPSTEARTATLLRQPIEEERAALLEPVHEPAPVSPAAPIASVGPGRLPPIVIAAALDAAIRVPMAERPEMQPGTRAPPTDLSSFAATEAATTAPATAEAPSKVATQRSETMPVETVPSRSTVAPPRILPPAPLDDASSHSPENDVTSLALLRMALPQQPQTRTSAPVRDARPQLPIRRPAWLVKRAQKASARSTSIAPPSAPNVANQPGEGLFHTLDRITP